MVKLREQQKRDLLHTTIKILETRYDVHMWCVARFGTICAISKT